MVQLVRHIRVQSTAGFAKTNLSIRLRDKVKGGEELDIEYYKLATTIVCFEDEDYVD